MAAVQTRHRPSPTRAIGRSVPRPDSESKVRGRTRFAADRKVAGLLHGRLVLAPYAHATIEAIDASAALAMPGVVAFLTAADLRFAVDDLDRLAEPLARSEVVFAGQPVALVVAETPEAAADAVEAVVVRYVPEGVVMDPEAAMAPGAPIVRHEASRDDGDGSAPAMGAAQHAAVGGGDADADLAVEDWSANVTGRHRQSSGDADAGLKAATTVVETRTRTSWVHQAHLEPQVCTAWLDDADTLVVEAAIQGSFSLRTDLARVLGRPAHRIRVVPTMLGGAFGAKWGLFEPLVASAALSIGRPVRLELERRDELTATNPGQATRIDVRLGADRDGRFTAIKARIVADAGAFEDYSIEEFATVLLGGPYDWPAYDIRAYGVRTNRFGTGPYRGPGAPQCTFALETAIDELAAALGLDAIELRRRNAAVAGRPMIDGEEWSRIGLPEVLAALESDAAWARRGDLPAGEGIGLAVGWWPGAKDAAAAVCRVSTDGSVQIMTGVADMSGVAGGFASIVAEVLAVEPAAVQHVTLDTGSAPPSPGSGGSTITYSAGRAIRVAADDARRQLLRAAARVLEIAESDLELVDGAVQPVGTPDRAIPIGRIVRANAQAGGAPIEGHGSTERPSLAPIVSGALARVRVDLETGVVTVLDFHLAQDVGRALNPALVTAQLHGGTAQSIGWGLLEQLVHDPSGQLLTGTFLDYAVPRAEDVPWIRTTIVEVPAPDGPFGAKGVGEGPVIPGAAAIANAVAAATGRRVRELPMSASSVWRALQEP